MPFYFRKECPLNSGYLTINIPPLTKHSSVHITSLLSHTYLLAERRQCAYGGKSSPAHGSACGNLV
ncbi:hypothetical protein DXB10_01640 [Escherichia coli]|nr:hypothetical protein DXB10_01640 [Escherichia coli]